MLCPKCKQEIDELYVSYTEKMFSTFSIDSDGCGRWSKEELVDMIKSIYRCPKCKKKIADNEEDAETILRGR